MNKEINLKVNVATVLQNLNIFAPIIILICVGLIMAGWVLLCFQGYTQMECSMDDIDVYIKSSLIALVVLILYISLLTRKGFQNANKKIIFSNDALIVIKQKKQYSIPKKFIKSVIISKSLFHVIGLKRNQLIFLKKSKEQF